MGSTFPGKNELTSKKKKGGGEGLHFLPGDTAIKNGLNQCI